MIDIEDNFNIYKQRLLKALKYDVLSDQDSPFYEINNIIEKELGNNPSLEELYKQIEKITYKDMSLFLKRVKLSRKMIMESGD